MEREPWDIEAGAEPVEVEASAGEGDDWAVGRGLQDPVWGTRTGVWCFYFEDGVQHSEVEYVEGKRQGPSTVWHPNGEKFAETNYVADKQNGEYRDWWDDGTPRRHGELRDDTYYGRWSFRNRDGSHYEADMVDGRVHGYVEYFGPNDFHFGKAEWDRGRMVWQDLRTPDSPWMRIQYDEDERAIPGPFACVCCEHLTFDSRRTRGEDRTPQDFRCPVCGWCLCGTPNHWTSVADVVLPPNRYSLADSRKNYQERGAADPEGEDVRPPRPDELP